MENVWPTLNGNGYVRDVPTMIDEAFAASLLGRRRQSKIYRGYISSLDDMMRRYSNDPTALGKNLTEMWKALFERLFDSVEVDVRPDDQPEPGTVNYPLTISIQITHKGVAYDLGYEVKFVNGSTLKVIGTLNGTSKELL